AEKLGSVKGDYKRVSPNDHANFGQSTNDTYPTALHLALLLRSTDESPNDFGKNH
ncbi:lyase family protein, partial [Escherichia coli]|uniref:lyase family protein n=1 Tax=Escherichia coli TaxID=562 RepID=UPI00301D42E0